ncbi:hypothetical protein BTM25_51550 [Actinomadura rubteroloni]|uniref:HTH cro/C1-type domain-containing protein n=1 Tax=Actinomadura rubteroloni TaxID=1926885 RepID=A0A2P4UD20_9ACTN|nr:helix-turn-helix transcriptional regulator [Actinomadura rubteroloni]POM22949.1 hypothetical protein BTM25_51550 [Actinomadura rubteroloni]
MPSEDELTRDPLVRAVARLLRVYREDRGISRAELAAALGCTAQWIESLEAARKPLSEATADDLDTFFKTPARTFWTLWKEIKEAGKHLLTPPGFPAFVQREAQAVGMDCFEAHVIPGLLQTKAYARAVLDTGRPVSEIQALVEQRMERQGALVRPLPLRAWFVLDEATLRRQVGSSAIMREQLEHLLSVTEKPNIQVRIVPSKSFTWAGTDGSFIMLELPKGQRLAYLEARHVASLTDDPIIVADTVVRFTLVSGEALPIGASRNVIEKALEGYR